MASLPSHHYERCPRCGSWLVNLEWDERINQREVQDLWHCCRCQNEFITVEAADDKEPSITEITEPFFTSLVME